MRKSESNNRFWLLTKAVKYRNYRTKSVIFEITNPNYRTKILIFEMTKNHYETIQTNMKPHSPAPNPGKHPTQLHRRTVPSALSKNPVEDAMFETLTPNVLEYLLPLQVNLGSDLESSHLVRKLKLQT